jgi:hypothetical protein
VAARGVHIVHPLFIAMRNGQEAQPEPFDSFNTIDQVTYKGAAGPLGPGTLFWPSFGDTTNVRMTIVFNLIEDTAANPGAAGGPVGCKDVAMFTSIVVPQLNGTHVLQSGTQNCVGCHSGGGAGNAMNLAQVPQTNDMMAQAAACQKILDRVNTANIPASYLFVHTSLAQGGGHQGKFVNQPDFDAFVAAISPWIMSEQ